MTRDELLEEMARSAWKPYDNTRRWLELSSPQKTTLIAQQQAGLEVLERRFPEIKSMIEFSMFDTIILSEA